MIRLWFVKWNIANSEAFTILQAPRVWFLSIRHNFSQWAAFMSQQRARAELLAILG
jgi:hypothetical protein